MVLVHSWGGFGTNPGEFVEPSSIELDRAGFVYVAGHEDRVQKFRSDGQLVQIFGTSGRGDGEFNHPHGLAITRSDEELVYVGDQENGRVQMLGTDGAFLGAWTDAEFTHIHDVGIDRETGAVYVGDYELDLVQIFSATGEPLGLLGGPGAGPGEFDGVWGISTDSQGNVYVADSFNRRVQKFDRAGTWQAEWTEATGVAFIKPTGIFVGADDIVYVCDSLASRIFLFEPEGRVREIWDMDAAANEMIEPEDVVVDPTGVHAYVAEVRSHSVLHFVRR